MSVKEKAKAFEVRRSMVGESPPLKKKSREEFSGNTCEDDNALTKSSAAPVPPPRKYKKNGTLKQPGDSSPLTERKENILSAIPAKSPSSTSPSTLQDDVEGQKKKPAKPPPPKRVSSLRRKSPIPASVHSLPAGKKPRPPVPPKPKNYVPKKFSAPSGDTMKHEEEGNGETTNGKADSAPSSLSGDHDSKFYFNLEKHNYSSAAPHESPDAEKPSQFFVSLDNQMLSASEETAESEKQSSSPLISAAKADDKETSSDVNAAYKQKGYENGVASAYERSTFYTFPAEGSSGKESTDLLEGLEIEAVVMSDDEGDEISNPSHDKEMGSKLLADSVDVNGVATTDKLGIVVREQQCNESLPADTSDTTENVKVKFSLLLEEECSVALVDDAAVQQKLFVATETEEGKKAEDTCMTDLNHGTENVVYRELNDEALEQGSSSESSNLVTDHTEDCAHDVENPTADVQLCYEDDALMTLEVSQENILDGEMPIDESHKAEGNVEQKSDSQSHDFDVQTRECVNDTSIESRPYNTEESEDIIMAEPVKDGMLISDSDHTVSKDSVEEPEEENQHLHLDKGALEVKEESERGSSLSESTSNVIHTDSEEPIEEISEEMNISSDIAQSEHNLSESQSENVESEDAYAELNIDETHSNQVIHEQGNEKESIVQTESMDSVGDTEVLEEVESVPISAAQKCTSNDYDNSAEGCKESDIVFVEGVGVLEPDLQEDKDEGRPPLPSSPEPVPPERKSRKTRQGKHTYENVEISTFREGNMQKEDAESDNILRRTQSFSKYESAVLSLPRPVQRISDDEAIYRVPSRVVPVQRYTNDAESPYSVPFAIPSHYVKRGNDYAVPKTFVVQANAVMDRRKADESGEIYAIPGFPTPVPVETFTEESNQEVTVTRQDEENIYVVPSKQSADLMVNTSVSAAPPPKPPRMSLEQDKVEKVPGEEAITKEVPKPVPRARATDDAKPELNKQKGSPSPVPRTSSKTDASGSSTPERKGSPSAVPRKGFKTDASGSSTPEKKSSPSPVPRKGSKTDSGSFTPEKKAPPSPLPRGSSLQKTGSESPANGSLVPVRRCRVNALQTNIDATPLSSAAPSSFGIPMKESTEDETPKRKVPPPPRPPPPVAVRISIASSEDSTVPPLTPGLDSDSDSDVGEEETPKGPSRPKTHHIAHEILSTERTFVDALKLVFEECYGTIKSANVVADSVLSDIFSDLENIYLLDSRFLQELEERMATWEENERIGDIIKKYGHFLKMYTQYVNGYDKAISVFQETMKDNPDFAKLVTQFQASERCHGLILSSYMLKPVQRIPSYRLLLIDYLKHLPKDSQESKDTETTLKIVSEVATHINESMKKMDSFEQLLKLQNMLVGHPEIVKAGRDYLKEGMLMKLCRKDMQERMFFLLTDVLLYTTPIGANQFKLNKKLPLLGMQVTVPDSPDFVNEFSIISTTRSFTLTASTPEERDEWVEALNNAIDVVTKRKITFVAKTRDAAGLLEQDGEGTKLGEKAPVWIPDARVTMCMSCTSPFTLTNRRHHCRACGNVVCGSCSDSTAPLMYLNYTEARVCDKCYDLLLKDFHTHEIHVDEKEEAAVTLPPLLQEIEAADKLLRKPTKFEMMRRFKSRKTKRRSQIIHPTHLTEVVANQEGIQMSGYLRVKKGRYGWKKSWFVLKDNVLYSYKASSDVVALETLPVLGYKIEDLGKEGDDFVFHLKHQGVPPIVFKADNETSAVRWVKELKKATTM